MNRIARLVALAVVLLAIFLAAVLGSWIRLRHQTDTIQKNALEMKQRQLARTLALTQPASFPWSDAYLVDLGTLLDARVAIRNATGTPAPSELGIGGWTFAHVIRDSKSQPIAVLEVDVTPPPHVRLGTFYRYTALVLLVLALGLIAILVTVLLFRFNGRRNSDDEADEQLTQAGHDFDSLTHLAQVSVKQRAELEHERNERLRADEDLHFQQVLLNRSLEEKIQLGRELHDGIIQSLYATGLTLEAAKKHIASSPKEAAAQLEAGLKSLNATIRDVRSYISGLAPENLRQQSFTDAVKSLVQTLGSGRDVSFELKLDEHVAAILSDAQVANLLQIVRESISNSLRHGRATNILVRLHENGDEAGLLVQDNGSGFDMAKLIQRGHGLENLKARAEKISAKLQILSTQNEGTRVVLTFPVSNPTAA
ncbi:MAG: sensor histidine kinase [Nibricoccus sp.]